jgi:hypothetical protein
VGVTAGIPTHCTECGAELLNAHELTGLCHECKLAARNDRAVGESNVPADGQP